MLRDAHDGMEKMSAIASAVKDERWGDAERELLLLQQVLAGLRRDLAAKVRDELMAPDPDQRDRG
jgi:hypothetical protein